MLFPSLGGKCVAIPCKQLGRLVARSYARWRLMRVYFYYIITFRDPFLVSPLFPLVLAFVHIYAFKALICARRLKQWKGDSKYLTMTRRDLFVSDEAESETAFHTIISGRKSINYGNEKKRRRRRGRKRRRNKRRSTRNRCASRHSKPQNGGNKGRENSKVNAHVTSRDRLHITT